MSKRELERCDSCGDVVGHYDPRLAEGENARADARLIAAPCGPHLCDVPNRPGPKLVAKLEAAEALVSYIRDEVEYLCGGGAEAVKCPACTADDCWCECCERQCWDCSCAYERVYGNDSETDPLNELICVDHGRRVRAEEKKG